MISLLYQRILKCLMLCSALLLLTPALRAQTVVDSSTSSGGESVGPTTGLGTLNYTVTYQFVTCDDSFQLTSTYQEWTYDNFVYVDGSGVSHAMSGAASFFRSNGDSPPCPGDYVGTGTLTGDGLTITFVPDSDGYGTATLQPISGHINPKFTILAVTYAPPGSQSNVNYSESSLFGTSTSESSSFTKTTTTSSSLKFSTGNKTIPGFNVSFSGNYSNGWTEETDTSSSISLNKMIQESTVVRGPSSSLGINHDYDVIWLWLNPLALFDVLPGPDTVTWTGYAYDETDSPGMDIYPVYVGYLNGHFAIPSDVATALARAWAAGQTWGPGQVPGLTSQDFATILAADPFTDPNYTVSVPAGSLTSSDGRFTVTGNQSVSYVPPPPGGNPITQTYIENYSTTDTQGQGAKQTHTVAWSFDGSVTYGFMTHFLPSLTLDLQKSWSHIATNQWSTTRTSTNSQSASLSVTGPAATDNYTGPTEFVVYQDNIYGTFMFYPAR